MALCESLRESEYIVRICPVTGKPVLVQYLGNDEIIELHNNTLEEDIAEVKKFLNL